jgi:hypothetical protein
MASATGSLYSMMLGLRTFLGVRKLTGQDHLITRKNKELCYAERQLLVVTEFLIEHPASSEHGMELRIRFPAIQL